MLNAKENLGLEGMGPSASHSASIHGMIAELDALRQKGVVTEAEFQAKKKELLQKM